MSKDHTVPVLLGPFQEEDNIGTVTVDRDALHRAIVHTLTREFRWTDARREQFLGTVDGLVAFLLPRLPGALSAWLRGFVCWELFAHVVTPDEFFACLMHLDPTKGDLLSSPAVVERINEMRAQLKGKDRAVLGRWFAGTARQGRPKHLNHVVVRQLYALRKRQIDRLFDE